MTDEEDVDDLFALFAAAPPAPSVAMNSASAALPLAEGRAAFHLPSQGSHLNEEPLTHSTSQAVSSSPSSQQPRSLAAGLDLLKTRSAESGERSLSKPAAVVEKHTQISVSRPTEVLLSQQLSLILAQYPFSPFSSFFRSGSDKARSSPFQGSLIGVVVRKSDPKTKGAGDFAVISMWDMTGFCDLSSGPQAPTAGNICPVLLTGAAFVETFMRLAVGDVVVVSHPEKLVQTSGQCMAKISEFHQMRVLGFAKSLGRCSAPLRASSGSGTGEICHSLVNTDSVKRCKYHTGSLLREALGRDGGTAAPAARVGPSPSPSPRFMSAAASTAGSDCATAMRTCSSAGSSHFVAVRRGSVVPSSTAVAAALAGAPSKMESPKHDVPKGTLDYAGVTRTTGSLRETGFNNSPETSFPSPAVLGTTSMGHRTLRRVIADTNQAAEEQQKRRDMREALDSVLLQANSGAQLRGKTQIGSAATSTAAVGRKRPRSVEDSPANLSSAAGCGAATTQAVKDVLSSVKRDSPLVISTEQAWEAEAKRLRAEQAGAPRAFAPLVGRPDPSLSDAVVISAISSAKVAQLGSKLGISKNSFSAKIAASVSRGGATPSMPPPPIATVAQAGTALGRLADTFTSRNDHARLEALAEASRKLDARALAQDAAFRALDTVTEEAAKAYFCSTCSKWSFSRQKKCLDEKHTGYVGDTVKRYFACKDCGTKAPVLGPAGASLVPLFCPRCRRNTVFAASTAAPVLPELFKPRAPA
jgi:hypothetical protein